MKYLTLFDFEHLSLYKRPPYTFRAKLVSRLGQHMLKGIQSDPKMKHIELRNVNNAPNGLQFLFRNGGGDLSIIPISEFMPKTQSVAFTNISWKSMMEQANEFNDYVQIVQEAVKLHWVKSIEFRSEFVSEIDDFENITSQLQHWREAFSNELSYDEYTEYEWSIYFECHCDHHLSVKVMKQRRNEQGTASSTLINGTYTKPFELVLESKEETFIGYDEDKMHKFALNAINTVLRWNGIDDSSFNVGVINIDVNGIQIVYLLISDDMAQLDLIADIIRRADTKSVFVEFESMRIPIRSHREQIEHLFAEKVMAKEVDEKRNEKLAVDLQNIIDVAALDWTSERTDKVDETKREIQKTARKEKENAEREEAERRATEKRLEHELGLNLLTSCKMVELPLFRLNTEQFWDCIGWWIENDVKHQNTVTAMKRVCAEYHISGAALCYAFLEQVDGRGLIENALRTQMEPHLTTETMNIIMESMKKWMFAVNAGALHSASTQLAARMMIQIPIQRLKNVLLEKRIDGKWFIEESQKEPNGFTQIVQRATGWSKSDCILLTEVLLRRRSLTKNQILERIQSVGERNWKDALSMEAITKMKEWLTLDYNLEDIQFVLRTRGTVTRQFSDSVLNLLQELKSELGPFQEEAFFDVVSSAIMINGGGERGRSPWICSFCGNLNVVDIVNCFATADISTCSLCGIKHQETIIMALRQSPTPFLGKNGHRRGVNVNGDTVDSANISSLERSLVDVNDRKLSVLSIWKEVHEIVSPNDFLDILYKAIEVYTEWNETVPGTRRANAYAAKHGILRNQSINVKHIAAILLYAKHTELSDGVFAAC